jgi:hypothetical protein
VRAEDEHEPVSQFAGRPCPAESGGLGGLLELLPNMPAVQRRSIPAASRSAAWRVWCARSASTATTGMHERTCTSGADRKRSRWPVTWLSRPCPFPDLTGAMRATFVADPLNGCLSGRTALHVFPYLSVNVREYTDKDLRQAPSSQAKGTFYMMAKAVASRGM